MWQCRYSYYCMYVEGHFQWPSLSFTSFNIRVLIIREIYSSPKKNTCCMSIMVLGWRWAIFLLFFFIWTHFIPAILKGNLHMLFINTVNVGALLSDKLDSKWKINLLIAKLVWFSFVIYNSKQIICTYYWRTYTIILIKQMHINDAFRMHD